jgi:hypothetical protein
MLTKLIHCLPNFNRILSGLVTGNSTIYPYGHTKNTWLFKGLCVFSPSCAYQLRNVDKIIVYGFIFFITCRKKNWTTKSTEKLWHSGNKALATIKHVGMKKQRQLEDRIKKQLASELGISVDVKLVEGGNVGNDGG